MLIQGPNLETLTGIFDQNIGIKTYIIKFVIKQKVKMKGLKQNNQDNRNDEEKETDGRGIVEVERTECGDSVELESD